MTTLVPEGRAALDTLGSELVAMFAEADRRLTASLALQVAAGLEQHPDDVARAVQLHKLRTDAEALARSLQQLTPAEVDRIIAVAAQQGTNAALREAAKLSTSRDITAATVAAATVETPLGTVTAAATHRAILSSLPAAAALRGALLDTTADLTRRILRWPDDVYRTVVARSATDVLLGLGTTRTAQARAWQDLVQQQAPQFVDRAGRPWNMASYVETATRTATRRAWDVQHEDTLARAGVNLVSIVVGAGSCKACADTAGKVWSVDGKVQGKVELQRENGAGTIVVDVEGSLDDARRHGWRHPNCRCQQVAYLPGLPIVADATTYDPKKEAERAQLRYLERQVRVSKARAAAAVTEEQRVAATNRVRQYQAKIRAHVNATGLNRQRFREQPNLGNG